MQKALVTGAAGFIGSHVVRELMSEGVDVRAMILPGEDDRNLLGVDVERVPGNVMEPETLDAALKGCDTLFHLAAIFSLLKPDRKIFYDVNVQGSRNALWAARKADLERIVYTASIAALGVKAGTLPADEETEFNQFDGASDYVLTKYLSQREALAFADQGMPIVVVNPCFPYGEGDVAPTPTGKIILDVANQAQFMAYDGGINIVDVNDVARGHVLAARKGVVGQKYILGNRNVTMKELFEMVAEAAGIRTRIIKMPMSATLAYAWLWQKLAERSGRQPTVTPKEARYSHQYLYYDTSKAPRELGLELTPVETSLERSIEWFRREGYIPRSDPWVTFTKILQKVCNIGLP